MFVVDAAHARDEGNKRKTIAGSQRRSSHPKQLDAGPFEAEVGSFWLHLAAEGKAGRTLDTYTKAVHWFAAAHTSITGRRFSPGTGFGCHKASK